MPTLKELNPCILTLKNFHVDFSFYQHKIDWLEKIITLILEQSAWKGFRVPVGRHFSPIPLFLFNEGSR